MADDWIETDLHVTERTVEVPDDLYNARRARREIMQRIRDMFPDETEESLADTIAGESSLEDAIIATLRAANENDATVAGLLVYVEKLKERAERLKYRSEKLKAAALHAALELNQTKFPAPDFTASVGQTKGKVIIIDEEQLPKDCFRPKYEINRSLIRDRLLTGVDVPGAELSNPAPNWILRIT